MKTIAITKFGDIDVFTELNLDKPKVKPGHVLIKVVATSVNPFDYKLRKGIYADLVPNFPAILHGDVAGIIEEVGADVSGFAVGDQVYGCVGGIMNMGGALAEYVLADANLIAHKPKSISLVEAAALPLVALTAWEGLITYANVQKGQTVLVHGGTGGVGHLAVQIAKWLGAKVFATSSSTKKLTLAKQLGADAAIDYKHKTVQDYVTEHTNGAGFDVVFDTVGQNNIPDSITAAALFGHVITVSAAGSFDLTQAFFKGLSIHLVLQPLPLITGIKRAHYHSILTKISELVDKGFIKPLVDEKKFAITEIGTAHHYLEQGQAVGKVVVTGF